MPYNKEILQDILLQQDCRTLDAYGKILPPTNSVYIRIANRMALRGSLIQSRHVYTIVNENRNGFRTMIVNNFKIEPENLDNANTSALSASLQNDTNASLSGSLFSSQIKLVLSAHKWAEMIPQKEISGGRTYWKLQEGYCSMLFVGYCVECEAKITGRLQKVPAKDVDVIFLCDVENIRPALHEGKKKRQLRGKHREKVANQLIEQRKDAVTFQREAAQQMKKFGGKNLPIVPHATTLRKAKEQQLLKLHRLESANPPLNLLNEAKNGKFAGCIHSISLLTFYCFYWLPEQQQIYTAWCRHNPDCILTIDATVGIAKRLNTHDPHVFLYQCVPRPPIVVCDFGRALVNAVAQEFGKCNDLQEYLQKCYNCVARGFSEVPATYMRLDVSHFVAMVARWKCLNMTVIAARRFYMRCICQIYQMDDFENVTFYIESLLAVALSESIGFAAEGKAVPSEIRMQALTNIIKGVNLKEIENNIENTDMETTEDSDAENDAIDTDWNTWVNSIYLKAEAIGKTSKEGSVINALFNPAFAQRVKKQLLPFLPLWTNIMRRHFGKGEKVATSSSVEAEFADLKGRAFKGKLPMRIDKFVLQHLDYLDGKIKFASNPRDLPRILRKEPEDEGTIHEDATDRGIQPAEESEIDDVTNEFTSNEQQKLELGHAINKFQTSTNEQREDIGNIVSSTRGQLKRIKSCKQNLSPDIEDNTDDEDSPSSLKNNKSALSNIASECSIWNSREEWGGKAKKEPKPIAESKESPVKKKIRKSSYLDTCPEWDYIKNTKISKLPLFKNGLFCQPVIMGDIRLNLKRTCAFDTLFQLVMSAMASNQVYYESLEKCTNRTVQLARKILVEKQKISASDYRERAEILSRTGLFEMHSFTRKIKQMDSECNVAHLAQYIFSDIPSYKTKVACQCGYEIKNENIIFGINIDVILWHGFGSMQQAVDDGHETQRTCRNCKRLIEDNIEYGPHLIIDTSVVTDDRYTNRNEHLNHTLESIANYVTIKDKIYCLADAATWSAGHYTGFAKS
ncbi:hypothetical protein KPH14_012736, partial [Odynerus spinipes]